MPIFLAITRYSRFQIDFMIDGRRFCVDGQLSTSVDDRLGAFCCPKTGVFMQRVVFFKTSCPVS